MVLVNYKIMLANNSLSTSVYIAFYLNLIKLQNCIALVKQYEHLIKFIVGESSKACGQK